MFGARKLSVSGVLALVALFVSLGGVGAAATGAFSGRQIANHTIPLSKLTPAALQLLRAAPNRLATDTGDKFSLAAGTVTGAIAWTDTPGLKSKRMASGIYQLTVPNGTFAASSPLVVLAAPFNRDNPNVPEDCTAEAAKSTSAGGATVTMACSATIVLSKSVHDTAIDTPFSVEIAGPPPG